MKRLMVGVAALLIWCGLGAQELSISTNVLDYANMGTLNAGMAYGFARHWSVGGVVKYNPFTWRDGRSERQCRQRSISAGARYWPWYVYSGWWFEGGLRCQEYNVGGFESSRTTEGERFGVALRAGYAYMLSPHFNVEAGLGVWAGHDIYTAYCCPTCGDVLERGEKNFILPSDIILTFSYIF